MALSRVTSGNAASGSLTYNAGYAVGDLILLVLENTANSTVPSTPTGYTNVTSAQDSTNGFAMRVVYKIATSTSETAPAPANCTSIAYAIYSSTDGTTPFVQVAGQSGSTSSISYSGIVTFGSSNDWVVTVGVAKGTTGNVGAHPPTSNTLVTEYQIGSDDNAIFDTNAPIASYSFNSKTLSAAVPWLTKTMELVAATSASSPSASASSSSSASQSPSSSASRSASSSVSPSLSPSASPSSGFADYSRTANASLPTNEADLATAYSAQDVTDVSTSNDVRVGQNGVSQYMIHQFKNFVGSSPSCTPYWEGQSTQDASVSTIFLQVYNRNTSSWETLASNNTASANTDFVLQGNIADLTNYKDGDNVISCRVYQLAI